MSAATADESIAHARDMAPTLLAAAEVADRKRVTPRTVARWAESGRLPVAQQLAGLRGPLLFDPDVVDAFDPNAVCPEEVGS